MNNSTTIHNAQHDPPLPDYDAQSALYNRLADETTTRNKATSSTRSPKLALSSSPSASTAVVIPARSKMFKQTPKMSWSRFRQTRSNTSISAGARRNPHEALARSATPSKILPSTTLVQPTTAGKTATAPMASSPSIPPPARLPSPITSASPTASIPNMISRRVLWHILFITPCHPPKNGEASLRIISSCINLWTSQRPRKPTSVIAPHSIIHSAYICSNSILDPSSQSPQAALFLSDSSANNM
jgi:hypothetical protein